MNSPEQDATEQKTAAQRALDTMLSDFNKPLELPPSIVGKRVTESYNAFDCYVCPNGHLQYNLTDEAKEEIRGRGVALPPICYEGAPCVLCAAAISPLETDVAILQNRVSNFMKMTSRLKEQQPGLLAINSDANKIALYLRGAYEHEIERGEPQHSGELSKAVVFYLKRERRRPSVVVGKVWRAMLRAMGV